MRPWARVRRTRIRLGKSAFAVLAGGGVIHRAWLGDRRFGYVEEHCFGDVGSYPSWCFGLDGFGYNAVSVAGEGFEDADVSRARLLPRRCEVYGARAPVGTVVVSCIALYGEVRDGSFFGMSLGADQDLARRAGPGYHVLGSRTGRPHRLVRAWRWDLGCRRWVKKRQSLQGRWRVQSRAAERMSAQYLPG
ncbi:ETEC_3214 domain-containing protein [Streptomyces sp. NPDC002763]|uniref:ETEC_3214 domain-containing protein n=1 Tax=Streptomyces sp. NPDC002763 TaxID=3154427 RepID=UPI003323D254